MTDLEKVLNNQDAKVILSGGLSLSGYLNADFSMEGSNTWSTDESATAQMINNGSSGVQAVVNALFPNLSKSGTIAKFFLGSQKILMTAPGSTVSWGGSATPRFTLDMIFISVSGEDVTQKIALLQSGVNPQKIQIVGNFGGVITAPLGFRRGGFSETAGRVAVRIGKWFKTSQIFVISSVRPSFSQVVTTGGRPLYATASVSLEASRPVDSKEVMGWLG